VFFDHYDSLSSVVWEFSFLISLGVIPVCALMNRMNASSDAKPSLAATSFSLKMRACRSEGPELFLGVLFADAREMTFV